MQNMFKKPENLAIIALVAVVLYLIMNRESSPMEMVKKVVGMSDTATELAPVSGDASRIDLDLGCAMKNGVGLSSALLPREVATQEDFGQFSPDEILKGQNYLDPRSQIGYPETIGGSLRNANQQVRSEPPNPRVPVTIFNTSTIVPDQMRAKFEIGC